MPQRSLANLQSIGDNCAEDCHRPNTKVSDATVSALWLDTETSERTVLDRDTTGFSFPESPTRGTPAKAPVSEPGLFKAPSLARSGENS